MIFQISNFDKNIFFDFYFNFFFKVLLKSKKFFHEKKNWKNTLICRKNHLFRRLRWLNSFFKKIFKYNLKMFLIFINFFLNNHWLSEWKYSNHLIKFFFVFAFLHVYYVFNFLFFFFINENKRYFQIFVFAELQKRNMKNIINFVHDNK